MFKHRITNKQGEVIEDDDPILRDGQRMTIRVVDAAPKDVTDAQAGYVARLTRRRQAGQQGDAHAAYSERLARTTNDDAQGHHAAHASYVARLTRCSH